MCFFFSDQDTPPELMPDESTMWGARYNSLNSLAACPNSTTDFAMLAQFVSTPFTHKTPSSSNFFPDQGTLPGPTHTHSNITYMYLRTLKSTVKHILQLFFYNLHAYYMLQIWEQDFSIIFFSPSFQRTTVMVLTLMTKLLSDARQKNSGNQI